MKCDRNKTRMMLTTHSHNYYRSKEKMVLTRARQTRAWDNFLFALPFITEFLAPKDLFNLIMSSVELMAEINMNTVVQVAMCNGNSLTRKTIENLFDLTSTGAIHTLSALRVLRLVNGHRCELCNLHKVDHVRKNVGMFICWQCTRIHTTEVFVRNDISGRRDAVDISEVVRHPRVLSNRISGRTVNRDLRYYIWSADETITQGLEKVGPIVRYEHIARMMAMMSRTDIDRFISVELNAPPMDSYLPFDTAVRANRMVAYNRVIERRARIQQLHATRKEQKYNRVLLLLTRISSHPDFREEMRDFLGYQMNPIFQRSGCINIPCIIFENPIIHTFFEEYLIAPSRVRTQAQIGELVNNLNGFLDLMNWANGDQ